MKKIGYTAITTLALTSMAGSSTLITASSITGHHRGDAAAGDGSIIATINLSGIAQTEGANSPVRWTHDNDWATDWQGIQLKSHTSSNAKIGWVVIDFGSAQTQLGEMLLWNVNEQLDIAADRGIHKFNIYYSSKPTVTAPAVSTSATDYDFASGGWTQLGGTRTLLKGDQSEANALDGTYDLSAIASARYIGIEMLSSHGRRDKVGLAEVIFTQVAPEPSSAVLLGLGGISLILHQSQ